MLNAPASPPMIHIIIIPILMGYCPLFPDNFYDMCTIIVNDIINFVFDLAEAFIYGPCKSRKQKLVMSFTVL